MNYRQEMDGDFQLTPVPADLEAGDLLGTLGTPEEQGPEAQFCGFRSGRERFCLPVLEVEEVVNWPTVTMLPLGPPYLRGIFNLRGTIVALIDIAITEGRRSEEHTSELQSRLHLVCRLLLEKKKTTRSASRPPGPHPPQRHGHPELHHPRPGQKRPLPRGRQYRQQARRAPALPHSPARYHPR